MPLHAVPCFSTAGDTGPYFQAFFRHNTVLLEQTGVSRVPKCSAVRLSPTGTLDAALSLLETQYGRWTVLYSVHINLDSSACSNDNK